MCSLFFKNSIFFRHLFGGFVLMLSNNTKKKLQIHKKNQRQTILNPQLYIKLKKQKKKARTKNEQISEIKKRLLPPKGPSF